jgi:uncharacterized protein (DUF2141 family)
MKLSSVIATGLFVFIVVGAVCEGGSNATLHVTVDGMEDDHGVAMVGVCVSKEDYEGKGEPVIGEPVAITNGKCAICFHDIPYGEYCVKVYHDRNGNGKLDTNLLGIPKEPYGFSNGARGVLVWPSWEKVRIAVSNAEHVVAISVK